MATNLTVTLDAYKLSLDPEAVAAAAENDRTTVDVVKWTEQEFMAIDVNDGGSPFFAGEVTDERGKIVRWDYKATAVARWKDFYGRLVLGMTNGDVVTLIFKY